MSIMNWRLHRTIAILILVSGAALCFGFGSSIINLQDKLGIFPLTWLQLLGVGLIYTIWTFLTMTSS